VVTLLAAIPLIVWDFSVSDEGFASSGDLGQWTWGVPTTGPVGVDTVWGTNLDGNYFNDATEYLELPALDLTGVVRPVLVFRHWFSIQPGDFGVVEVNDGGGFTVVDPVFGYPDPTGFVGVGGWKNTSVDLTGFGVNPRVRFTFTADATQADEGWFLGDITLYDGDATPPQVSAVETPGDTQELSIAYPVSLLATDDVAVVSADLYYSIDGGPETVIACADSGGDLWDGAIPAQNADTDVSWYAVVNDGIQTTRFPVAGTLDFRVFLAAPENFRGPDTHRLVGNEVTLSWDPPVTPHTVLSYRVEDAASSVDVPGLEATVAVDEDAPLSWTVTALYDAGFGDASEVLELDVEVPELDPVDPQSAYQGETVRVQLQGASLYLFDEVAAVDFGAGVEVSELEVFDVNGLSAVLMVADDAAVGPSDVSLTGTQGTFTFADAFEILDGATAPRILEVDPIFGIQGDDLTVRVTASEAYAGELDVDGGDDLVVTKATADAEVARVKLVINNSARIGNHTLVLDDGVRLWTAEFEVKERVFTGSTGCRGCATNEAPTPAWALLLLLFGTRRRR